MSGNALTGKCDIVRIPGITELNKLYDNVTRSLGASGKTRDFTYNSRRTIVLGEKNMTYGDLDIVVSENYLTAREITIADIAKSLGSKAWAENGRVWSFEVAGHQVDFIRVHANSVFLNSVLLGHGGAGLLFKYIPRPFGFKLNEGGLVEPLKDGNQTFGKAMVTMDWETVRSFFFTNPYIGSYIFSSGFAKITDVYDAILNSDMFTLGAFDIDANYNYVGKASRLDYPPFKGFVDYVKQQGTGVGRISRGATPPWSLIPRADQIKKLEARMKGMTYHAERSFLIEEHQRDRLLRSKFSGDLAMAATGLSPGNDVGLFMEAYRASFASRGEFEFHIFSSAPQTLVDSMQAFYVRYEEQRLETLKAKLVEGNDAEIIAFG